jgi:hypothetical protein
MTATVTEVTISTIMSNSSDTLSTTLGIIATLLLLVLLVQKEIISALDNPRAKRWADTLNIAIVPLLLAFGLVVAIRFTDLLH